MVEKTSDKIRVAVLYGGRSAEHEISLRSALNVIKHLDPSRFDVIPIGIHKEGQWFIGSEVFTKSLKDNKVSPLPSPDHPTWFTPEWISKPTDPYIDKSGAENFPAKRGEMANLNGSLFDVVFPVVHGTLCEDGTLQGLLEMAGLPYVGCGVLSSAIGMDKDVAKRLAIGAGILVAPYIAIKQADWQNHEVYYLKEIAEKIRYPLFVKPANTGSSIGISKVKTPEQLPAAISFAFRFDTKILIEQALDMIELEVAVLESLETMCDPIVSVIGEVRTKHEFYSYDAKYIDENGALLLIPAPIPAEVKEEARLLAKKLFLTLECEGMARVDLFLTKDKSELYFNEINTLPGFTQISMYPKLMEATGISYPDLLTHLIELAIKRHKNKSQLQRSYT